MGKSIASDSNEMTTTRRAGTVFASMLLALGAASSARAPAAVAKPYGMGERVVPAAYLHMPHQEDGALPKLLSQTGAFSDLRNLVPASGLIPYELIVPFWSDRAVKTSIGGRSSLPRGSSVGPSSPIRAVRWITGRLRPPAPVVGPRG